ncbi:MAG: RNA methyltransferase [Bacteroidota bacterium]
MTPERATKLYEVAMRRQLNLTVILENVHDNHNIGAVLRSCDSVGISEVFVLYTHLHLIRKQRIRLGKRTTAGTRRWIEVHYHTNLEECFAEVRSRYDQIWGTHISDEAKSLYDLDLTQSVALLFGNENEGISEAALAQCDGNFLVPQMGMVQSLNISVACAVSLYEAYRQRDVKGMYDNNTSGSPEQLEAKFEEYMEIHDSKRKNRSIEKKT